MGIGTIILLAVGLAMDAFAVSICGGITIPAFSRVKGGIKFGLWFGFFQALMPLIGYFLGAKFAGEIAAYDHWIAFILLCYLGITMIREANDSCTYVKGYGIKEMTMLAIATSIDALAVGVSFAFLNVDIWSSAFIIGLVTFVISFIGCVFGSAIGTLWKKKAEIAGGLILIIIGLEILYEHLT